MRNAWFKITVKDEGIMLLGNCKKFVMTSSRCPGGREK